MNPKKALTLTTIISLALAGLYLAVQEQPEIEGSSANDIEGSTVDPSGREFVEASFTGSEQALTLEVSETEEEIRTGLMNRSKLDVDGMIFLMPEEEQQVFWMKNTLIPLDIVFLDSERRVINIEKAWPPPPGTPERELRRYRSDEPAKYVVELPQNRTEELGVSKGDRMSWD